MSRINGDKARSALQKRRRIVQRMKDRLRRSETPQPTDGEKKVVQKKSTGT